VTRRPSRTWGWIAFGLLSGLAVLRAVTADNATPTWRADPAARRAIFQALAVGEQKARADAARAFPGDPWSADDDFHNHEQRRAHLIAAERGLGLADVLRAIDEGLHDEGLHEHPPSVTREPLIATVPPCRPRPVY